MDVPDLSDLLKGFQPEIGVVLGSGLGFFADDRIEVSVRLPYEEIDGFPVSTVPGHAGRFVCGTVGGRRVICMQGRFHFYEGYTMRQLTLPIRVMAKLGVQSLVLTNAAGGINRDFSPGDLMLLRDHINFLGTNPLIGRTDNDEVRFPDMSEVYDGAWRASIREHAASSGLDLKEGVYLATTGPSFETPAEIGAFAALGADAVGMSTVPEAIVARQLGLSVVAVSCITNEAAGISKNPLSHEEVSETADRVRPVFADLLQRVIELA